MRRRTPFAAALTLGLALAACGGGQDGVPVEPAQPVTSPPGPGTELTVTVDESGEGDERRMTLTCDPAGGDHPDPEAACAALQEAGGAAAFEPVPEGVVCTEIYGGPQKAHVSGTVEGQPVDARLSRVNGCEISLWDAVAPVLDAEGPAT